MFDFFDGYVDFAFFFVLLIGLFVNDEAANKELDTLQKRRV